MLSTQLPTSEFTQQERGKNRTAKPFSVTNATWLELARFAEDLFQGG